MIERVTLKLPASTPAPAPECDACARTRRIGLPGLRIAIRATTSSLSDYPEWSLDELDQQYRNALITDGTCS